MLTERCNIYDEKNEMLTSIISKQQRALNEIDAGDRERSLLVRCMNACSHK